ncbi:MAG: hypothetical protein ACK40Q_09580, partial [Pseudothermotoga sp.]
MVELRKLSESEGEQFVIELFKKHVRLTTLQIDDFAKDKNVQCPDSTVRFLAKLKLKKILLMIIAISLLFIIGVFSKRLLPSELYPFAILMIAIALIYHSSFISSYLVTFGSDVAVEHFVFKITQNTAYWGSPNPYFEHIGYGRIHSMLSVTILPTIYSSLLNIDSTWVFKSIFPLIFSFVPLGLYQIWKGYVGKKYAFISAFLFMSYETFYTEMLGLNRQMIAELFFVLLLLVIVNKKMKQY